MLFFIPDWQGQESAGTARGADSQFARGRMLSRAVPPDCADTRMSGMPKPAGTARGADSQFARKRMLSRAVRRASPLRE